MIGQLRGIPSAFVPARHPHRAGRRGVRRRGQPWF